MEDTLDDDLDDSLNGLDDLIEEDEENSGAEINLEDSENSEKPKSKFQEKEQEYLDLVHKFYDEIMLEEKFPDNSKAPEIISQPAKFYETIMNLGKSHAVRLQEKFYVFLSKPTPDQETRMGTVTCFWDFYEHLFGPEGVSSINTELQYFVRYNMLVPSAVAPGVFSLIKSIDVSKKPPPELTIYYLDEWINGVSAGSINPTVMDDTALSGEALILAQNQKVKQLTIQKNNIITTAQSLDKAIENDLKKISEIIGALENRSADAHDIGRSFNAAEIQSINSIVNIATQIKSKNNQLDMQVSNIKSTQDSIDKTKQDLQVLIKANPDVEISLEGEEDSGGGGGGDDFGLDTPKKKKKKKEKEKEEPKKAATQELNSRVTIEEIRIIRQMAKMCVGKRGNHFPILVNNYFSGPEKNFGSRERVYNLIKDFEIIDYTLFQRERKGQSFRIFPLVVLIPTYGMHGVCWEPFERINRNTSAPKIAIPMFSQNLEKAVMESLGDYRWQATKEKAGPNWMQEGLSGWFFQWHEENVKKGEIKQTFIENYINWMTWESQGVQKLTKEVRDIFWRFIPFPKQLKEMLGKRSNVYAELVKKDANREMSLNS